VPAPEIEKLVLDSVRNHCASEHPTAVADRDLIERYLDRVIVKPQALEVRLVLASDDAAAQTQEPGINNPAPDFPTTVTTITLAWTASSFAAVKGIIYAPSAKLEMKPESRDALLTAIAKARGWIADIRLERIAAFAEIAKREAQGERHIRLLAPLAFVSPRIVAAIADGTAPADLTVTGLAKALPYSWAEQEQCVGLLK
jgi:site-specific DNA recombinase